MRNRVSSPSALKNRDAERRSSVRAVIIIFEYCNIQLPQSTLSLDERVLDYSMDIEYRSMWSPCCRGPICVYAIEAVAELRKRGIPA